MLTVLDGIPAHQLAEQAVGFIQQRQRALFELVEKLVPRYLDQRLMLGIRRIGKHDAHDPNVAVLVRAFDRGWLAAVLPRHVRPRAGLSYRPRVFLSCESFFA